MYTLYTLHFVHNRMMCPEDNLSLDPDLISDLRAAY